MSFSIPGLAKKGKPVIPFTYGTPTSIEFNDIVSTTRIKGRCGTRRVAFV
jgi:hypothetical protein